MSAVRATILDPEAEIAEISGFLNVQHARLVRVVEQALVDGDWLGQGIHTPAQWLALRAGISPARARLIVRVAERRNSFPEVVEAFEAGELTLDQVAEVVKAPAWAGAQVLDFAKIATVTQLRRTMRSEFFDGDPDEPDPVPVVAEPTDRLTFGPTGESRWRINGEFDLDAGLRVEAALTEAKDSMFERGDAAATWADALLEVAETALGAVVSENRRDRYRTWLHVDVSNGSATTTDGWRIPMTVRDRLLCDGVVQPVWERDGAPFSVGRSQRIVPERTRRMIERRDRGCRVPGCTADRFVEIHHIIHWSNGGATDTWNLISLCARHHRLHHQGELGIAGNADDELGVAFTDSVGRAIGPSGRPAVPNRAPDPPARPYEPPIGGRIDYRWVGGSWIHPNELQRRRAAARARGRPHPPST